MGKLRRFGRSFRPSKATAGDREGNGKGKMVKEMVMARKYREGWRRLEKFEVVLDCYLGHFLQQKPTTHRKDIEKNKMVLLRISEIVPLNGNYMAFARL